MFLFDILPSWLGVSHVLTVYFLVLPRRSFCGIHLYSRVLDPKVSGFFPSYLQRTYWYRKYLILSLKFQSILCLTYTNWKYQLNNFHVTDKEIKRRDFGIISITKGLNGIEYLHALYSFCNELNAMWQWYLYIVSQRNSMISNKFQNLRKVKAANIILLWKTIPIYK